MRRSGLLGTSFSLRCAILVALGVGGCAAKHYGGGDKVPVHVQLAEGEEKRTLYLIPHKEWTKYPQLFDPNQTTRAELDQRLAQYRVDEQSSKEVDTIPYDVVVWDHGTLRSLGPIHPSEPDQKFELSTKQLGESGHQPGR